MTKSTALQNDTHETRLSWAPLLVKALRRVDTHSPQDVWDAIMRGDMKPWLLNGSIVITLVRVYPRLKACEVFAAAGDFADIWCIMDEQVEPWAKAHGCKRIQGGGREGWKKSAESRGYRQTSLMMAKELG